MVIPTWKMSACTKASILDLWTPKEGTREPLSSARANLSDAQVFQQQSDCRQSWSRRNVESSSNNCMAGHYSPGLSTGTDGPRNHLKFGTPDQCVWSDFWPRGWHKPYRGARAEVSPIVSRVRRAGMAIEQKEEGFRRRDFLSITGL